MNRNTHRQRNRLLTAFGLGNLDGALHRSLLPGNHDLTGRVEVGGLHHSGGSCFATDVSDHIGRQPQQRGDQSCPRSDRLRHIPSAFLHDADGVTIAHSARGNQGRVFTETVTGNGSGCDAGGLQGAERGDAAHQQSGLRMFRQIQFVCRPFETEGGDVIAQHRRGFVVDRSEFRISLDQCPAHSHGLGALAWKHKPNTG